MDAGRYPSFRIDLGSVHKALPTLWCNLGAGIGASSRLVKIGEIGEPKTSRDLYVIHL